MDSAPSPADASRAAGHYLGPVSASPAAVVDAFVEFAALRDGDVVYDVGCGDGRVCVAAARRCASARCVGLELDPAAAERARAAVAAAGLQERVTIVQGDAFEADLSQATVLFLYLLPKGNAALSEKLRRECKPGTRLVAYMFRMPPADWDGELAGTTTVGALRPGGVDTSAFTRLFLYVLR